MAAPTRREDRSAADAAMDVAEQMLRGKLTRDEARSVYAMALDVWKMQIATSWTPTRRAQHSCSASTCTMRALLIEYVVSRTTGFAGAHSVVVTVEGTEGQFSGGDAQPPRQGSVMRGTVADAFVCTATGLLHICNPALCGGEADSRREDKHAAPEIGEVCRVTGRTYGGPAMVHRFWRPGAQSATSESTGLSRRDTIDGLMALSRARRSCNYSMGSWSDFLEHMNTLPLVRFDTAKAMQDLVKECMPKRHTCRDAFNEYMVWAIARVASLYSTSRQNADIEAANRVRAMVDKKIQNLIATSPTQLTIEEVRVVQVGYMNKHKFPSSFMMPETTRRRIIVLYARQCFAYWVTVCTNTAVPATGTMPAVTAGDRANALMFPDFVVACMYMFKEGLRLPPDVTHTATGAQIIPRNEVLHETLPPQNQLQKYTCSKDAVLTQRRLVNEMIIAAVRDHGVNPLLLMPDATKLDAVDIDILPELTRHRDRKRKRT